MKNKLKKFLIILAVIVVISIIIVILINCNKKVIVNDYTLSNGENVNAEKTNKSSTETNNYEVKSVINKYVKIPTEEEAQKINAGITAISSNRLSNTITITMNSLAREVFDFYGKGDIFILDGDENTPLKQVYFGKIASKYVNSNGELIVEVEEPAIDEIFDELNVNADGLLTEENINRVQLADGVTLRWVDDVNSEFQEVSHLNENKNYINNLTEFNSDENFIGPLQKLNNIEIGGKTSFVFDIDLGLEYDITNQKFTSKASGEINSSVEKNLNIDELKLTNETEETDTGKSIEYSKDFDDGITEKKETSTTTTKDKKTTTEKTTTEKPYVNEEDESVVDNSTSFQKWKQDVANYENKLALGVTGKVGFDEISSKVNIDYNLLDGFKDVNVSFLGSALAETEIKAEASVELGGKRTKVEIPNVAEIQGLEKKLIPLGYLDFTGATIPFGGVNAYLDHAKLSAGFMIYMDFSGKINLSVTAKASAGYDFEAKADIFKDGKFVNEITVNDSLSANFEFAALASVSARADLFGFSAIITIANVNVTEIVIFDLYFDFEAQAEFKATASYGTSKTINSDEPIKEPKWKTDIYANASGYIGLYIDIGRVKVNLKFTTLPGTYNSKTSTMEFDKTLYKHTIWEYGSSAFKTGLDPSASYNEVSATNSKYEIYRDSDGNLLRKNCETGNVLKYDIKDGFVVICGIDQTYLYLLQGSSSNYNIYRMKIDGNENPKKPGFIEPGVYDMKIASNVGDVFLQDEKYIYFVESDDETTLKKVRKFDKKVSTVSTFDNRKIVNVIDELKNNRLYVAVIDNSSWAMILGSEPEGIYVQKQDEVVGAENMNIEAPAEYISTTESGYKVQMGYVGRSFLRGTVNGMKMIAKNGTTTEMLTDVGWNGSLIGEFVIHNEQNQDGDTVHSLGYYSAETGEFIKLTQVENEYAVWTTTIGKDGRIYYIDIDKDSGNKKLCSVSSAGDVKVEKEFKDGEFNVDMNNTGVATMNSTMIFYSFTDDQIQVQLRYDIN